MSGTGSRFDARRLASKLRQIALDLRRASAPESPTERLARRLEYHAESMIRPDGGPGYLPFALRAERLGAD